MNIQRVYVKREDIIKLLLGDLEKKNSPVGFSYCEDEKDTSCSVFMGTDRKTGELSLTKSGHLVFNVKSDAPRKKGDHQANTPEVSAEAAPAGDEAAQEAAAPPPAQEPDTTLDGVL